MNREYLEELIDPWARGELADSEREQFEAALEADPDLRAEAEDHRRLLQAISTAAPVSAPAGLLESALRRAKSNESLAATSETTEPAQVITLEGGGVDGEASAPGGVTSPTRRWAVAAAAAFVMLAAGSAVLLHRGGEVQREETDVAQLSEPREPSYPAALADLPAEPQLAEETPESADERFAVAERAAAAPESTRRRGAEPDSQQPETASMDPEALPENVIALDSSSVPEAPDHPASDDELALALADPDATADPDALPEPDADDSGRTQARVDSPAALTLEAETDEEPARTAAPGAGPTPIPAEDYAFMLAQAAVTGGRVMPPPGEQDGGPQTMSSAQATTFAFQAEFPDRAALDMFLDRLRRADELAGTMMTPGPPPPSGPQGGQPTEIGPLPGVTGLAPGGQRPGSPATDGGSSGETTHAPGAGFDLSNYHIVTVRDPETGLYILVLEYDDSPL